MRLGAIGTAPLTVDAAPVVVAPLTTPRDLRLPRSLVAPAPFDDVRTAIASEVSALIEQARFGVSDELYQDMTDRDGDASRRAPSLWLSQDDAGSWRPDDLAEAGLRIVRDEARAQLPAFITDRYELLLDFAGIDRWFTEPPIRLRLAYSTANGYRREFDIEHVADGFRLWLQLALSAGIDALARTTLRLQDPVHAAAMEAHESQGTHGDAGDSASEWLDRIVKDIIDGVPSATVDDATTARILIIDEPERHLHSRLMRQAANWLAAFAGSTDTSLLVASHGTAFLALGHDVAIARVRRVDDRIAIEPMSAGDRETLDRIAAELGLDRGELLTTVGCFMIVEGEHDKIVLETIFGRELRIAGVFIAPVRGTGGAGLFDSETLWRFSSAPALIVTDKLSADLIQLTRDDPEAAIVRLAGTNVGEERALLAALKEMRETDKQLHFMGHPGADLIDALDANVIAAVHCRFPGHETATAAYNAHASSETKPMSRKSFYEREYGIPAGNHAYGPLAEAHARHNVRPPALEAVVECAIELATEFRSP